MARRPILERRGFITFINRNLKLTQHLDCNVVEVEGFGTMVEPRQFGYMGHDSKVLNWDPVDSAFDSETLMDEGAFANQYGTYITQRPYDFQY